MAKFLQLLIRARVKLLILLTVLCLQDRHIFCLADNTKNPVCLTPECQELGAYYLANRNTAADPCHNFFDYACLGWEKKNPRPLYSESWAIPHLLEDKAAAKMRKLLESTTKSPIPDVEVAKTVYKKCVDLPFMPRREPAAVKRVMEEVGNWPMQLPKNQEPPQSLYTWKIDNAYLKITGESALFRFKIAGNSDKTDRISLLLGPPESIYGMIYREDRWTRNEGVSYKIFLRKLIRSVYAHTEKQEKDVIDFDLPRLLEFRDTFTTEVTSKDYDDYTEMTLKEFQVWYDTEAQLNELAQIDWFEQVRAIRVVEANDQLNVLISKSYFTALARALRMAKKRVIANHIHIYFAERHVMLNAEMKEVAEKSVTQPTETRIASGSLRYDPAKWQQCIENHNMVHTLGQMYVQVHFPQATQNEVVRLLEIGKQVQKAQISESTWLHPISKAKALKKVDNIKTIVGYPEWYDKHIPMAERVKTDLDPLEANACYNSYFNRLSVTAAYMQMPVYAKNLPYVIEYAATLSVLGHELYHAFDEEGIYYDENRKKGFLPPAMLTKYKSNTKCFLDQYSSYKEAELRKLGYRVKVDGITTLGEDIADVMGLKLAHLGYVRKLNKEKGVCAVLPGFENFGCDKLFFLAFANTLCADTSAHSRQETLFGDRHSLNRIRVNGAVANMEEFRDAFNCPKRSRLNIRDRCNLWTN